MSTKRLNVHKHELHVTSHRNVFVIKTHTYTIKPNHYIYTKDTVRV